MGSEDEDIKRTFFIGIIAFFMVLLLILTIGSLYAMGFFSRFAELTNTPVTYPTATPGPMYLSINGTFINDTIPQNMDPGKKYDVSIITLNTGDTPWSSTNNITISAHGETADTLLFNGSDIAMDPGVITKNGSQYMWKVTLTAPQYIGNYTLEYRMKNNSNDWFGDTLIKNVTVGNLNNSVSFTSVNIKYYSPLSSASMARNSLRNVSISVKNMGRYDWTEADHFWLGAVDYEPNSATTFNHTVLFHIAPEGVIRPGGEATWKFQLYAPPEPGTYELKYRMRQDDHWFGKTLSVNVTVT